MRLPCTDACTSHPQRECEAMIPSQGTWALPFIDLQVFPCLGCTESGKGLIYTCTHEIFGNVHTLIN